MSKLMTRLLRHDASIFREDDGAVTFVSLIERFKDTLALCDGQFDAWASFLAKVRGREEKISRLLESLFVR